MQRTKVEQEYSFWKEIKYGIPQGFILVWYFKIDLCDLFFIMKDVDIVIFADDNTLFMTADNITDLVENLEDFTRSVFTRFAKNQRERNTTKCHFLLSTNEKVIAKVDSAEIENNQSEKLLGIAIDS